MQTIFIGTNGLGLEEVKALVNNKISWKKCESCDCNGKVWFDTRTGERSDETLPEHEGYISWDNCNDCYGIGYNFYYKE